MYIWQLCPADLASEPELASTCQDDSTRVYIYIYIIYVIVGCVFTGGGQLRLCRWVCRAKAAIAIFSHQRFEQKSFLS